MTKRKSLLSLVLALCLCFMLAVPALAAEEVNPLAHDMEYKQEVIHSCVVEDHYIDFAGGQPANGTVFTSPGGFFWRDGGNEIATSVNATWGLISVGISCGSVGGTAGEWISAPVNTPCKLAVYKDVQCTKYATYERLIGTTTWRFTGYKEAVIPIKTTLKVQYGDDFKTVWNG